MPRERKAGVVSASTGNHGLAIGHASGLEGVDLILFLPETVAEVKRKKIEAMGVNLRFFGDDCEKTEVHARGFAEESGRIYVSPYNDFDIVAGQGTVGVEVLEDLPDVQDIVVPVGGGGLIAGIGAYAKSVNPAIRIVGVEPETSAFMKASIEAGKLVAFAEKPTFADALAGGIEAGSITFPLCRKVCGRMGRWSKRGRSSKPWPRSMKRTAGSSRAPGRLPWPACSLTRGVSRGGTSSASSAEATSTRNASGRSLNN